MGWSRTLDRHHSAHNKSGSVKSPLLKIITLDNRHSYWIFGMLPGCPYSLAKVRESIASHDLANSDEKSDLRSGVCPGDFQLSQAACCAGLDVRVQKNHFKQLFNSFC